MDQIYFSHLNFYKAEICGKEHLELLILVMCYIITGRSNIKRLTTSHDRIPFYAKDWSLFSVRYRQFLVRWRTKYLRSEGNNIQSVCG
jgi:hypothetical protein